MGDCGVYDDIGPLGNDVVVMWSGACHEAPEMLDIDEV